MLFLSLAAVFITGTLSFLDNAFSSILMFFFFASSHKFKHIRVFLPASNICVARFKFRSNIVASKTSTIKSVLLKHIKSLATSSSLDDANKE